MKKAILFIGLPASGKSTYIRENVCSNYFIVDADSIKELHPDYDVKNPELVHEWSVKMAEIRMGQLAHDGVNICMDSGGVNNSYQIRIINMLKSYNYKIHLIYMDTPLEICIERNSKRNRQVPERVIREKSEKLLGCLKKQLDLVNTFTHVKEFKLI